MVTKSLLLNSKIQFSHLARLAIIYVRQSSPYQVEHHTGSTSLQVAMREYALQLGWPEANIIVVVQDLGRSGTTTEGRDGYKWMCDQIYDGRVGAVFYTDASRLARDGSDFLHLIKLCDLGGTLFIDDKGICDPRNNNDRLLLGIKGLIGDNDGRERTSGLNAMKQKKAEKGELRFRLPIGFVHNDDGKVVLDPDEEVRNSVQLVFEIFERERSGWAVIKYFTENKLKFPYRIHGGPHNGELRMGNLYSSRVISLLHNPTYAGARAYGRTQQILKKPTDGSLTLINRKTQRKRQEWLALKLDAHLGYISWDQYLRNVKQLEDNRFLWEEEHPGAPRTGFALLQGIAFCGKCGRRMHVKYRQKGTRADYLCHQAQVSLALPKCQSFPNVPIDSSIVRQLLKAIEPAQIEMSIDALERLEERATDIERQWKQRLKRAQKEADTLRRHIDACDPDNSLVVRNLYRELNEKLIEVDQIESEQTGIQRSSSLLLDEEERRSIRSLASDLPRFWRADTTTNVERKHLLRLLIQDVVMTREGKVVHVSIRWQTGACTKMSVPFHEHEAQVVEIIRRMSRKHTHIEIAEYLNAQGFIPLRGEEYTGKIVQKIRYIHRIPSTWAAQSINCVNGQREDGRYTVKAAARVLNASFWQITSWCKKGRLDGIRSRPGSHWWVRLTPEIISECKREP
ncbi:MAG: recombinase family protein [Pyrinomonadaceae bacterium]